MTAPTFTIRASTTDAEIENAISFLDMRREVIERRNDAAAVIDEQGDQTVLDLYDIDGVTVLWSEAYCYAFVNETSPGVSDSLVVTEDQNGVTTPTQAAAFWKSGEEAV